MENWNLPPELDRLERELAGRPRPEPVPELRGRVILAVRGELRRNGARGRWRFAAGVAAAALVWMNLSLSATDATDYGLRLRGKPLPVGALAEQIQQAVPELPPREARRQAILLQAGSGLIQCPLLPAPSIGWDEVPAFLTDDLRPEGE